MAGAHESSVARDLLAAANRLMVKRTPGTRGLWPQATALLARQALEVALKTYWSARAPGVEEAPMRAHHHAYELSPTWDELAAWCGTVAEVVEQTERAWWRASR